MLLLPPCSLSFTITKPCEEVIWSYNHRDPHAKIPKKLLVVNAIHSPFKTKIRPLMKKKLGIEWTFVSSSSMQYSYY